MLYTVYKEITALVNCEQDNEEKIKNLVTLVEEAQTWYAKKSKAAKALKRSQG